MKTTSVQQVPRQWADILRWAADGEAVEMTQQDRVVARLVPAAAPDFLGRAKAAWGDAPPGQTLSAIVSEDRGGES
jgi:antitoxin (DNA-binding transcriptional repressor) of toxin-antitoxin stability system